MNQRHGRSRICEPTNDPASDSDSGEPVEEYIMIVIRTVASVFLGVMRTLVRIVMEGGVTIGRL